MPDLLMITGPIAAGKSTVAALVVDRLRDSGLSVAGTDLDTIAEMALPTLPDWDWAHRIHGRLVGEWLATGLDVVVDEGTETPDEVEGVLGNVPAGTSVVRVVLVAEYEQALARSQNDPGRGLSKQPDFLRQMYDRFEAGLPDLVADLTIDVEQHSPAESAAQIVHAYLTQSQGAR